MSPLPPNPPSLAALATKGDDVEEWIDLRFFRPIGAWMTRALYPTRVAPDQVTLASLVIGLAAGHLFVYPSPWLNAAGFVLFIISDLFDSADGQLARMRGTSTRFGRALDGISDGTRFISLGVHLVVRLALFGGWWWPTATLLACVAAVSQSAQSTAIDFIRHAYLALGTGEGSELDVEEPPPSASASWFQRVAASLYRTFVRRQAAMFPRSVALIRAERQHRLAPDVTAAYRARVRPLLSWCPWLGQNFRFLALGATAVAGWPAGLLWITVLPMNLLLAALVAAQERRANWLLSAQSRLAPPAPPPPAPPAVAVGGD